MSTWMTGVFRLSEESPEEFSQQIFDTLITVGCDKKETVRFRLGLEECLSACRENGMDEVEYKLTRHASRAVVKLRLPGTKFNPLYGLSGMELDDSLRDYLSRIVTGFTYAYQGEVNILVCRLNRKRKLPSYMPMLFAVASALLFSQLLRLTPWSAIALNEIIAPLASGFLRLLNTFATPMIFFSVLCGLTNLADVGALNVLGKSLMKRMCLWGISCAAISLMISLLTQGNFAGLGTSDLSFLPAARNIILGIIPESFIGAFAENSALSVLLLAFMLAAVINRRRDSLPCLHPLLGELNEISADALAIVCKLLPVYVFLCVSKLVLSSNSGTLLSVLRIIGVFLLVWISLLAIHGIVLAAQFSKKTPAMIKGMLPGTLIALTTASGSSAMSQTMKDCRDTLGLPDDLSHLGVPVYTVMNKPLSAANIVVMVVVCGAISGISLNIVQCALLIVISFCFSAAAPPVPNGTAACFAIAFSQFGIEGDMLALAVAAHAVNTFLTSGGNVFSVHTQLALLANKLEKLKPKNNTSHGSYV